MASVNSRVLEKIFKVLNFKNSFDEAFNTGVFDKNNINEPPKKLYSNLSIEKTEKMGRNTFILKPKGLKSKTHILYLHGGGYVFGFSKIHWTFMNDLIKKLNCIIIAPDYPLAPKFTYKDSFEMISSIYKELVEKVGGDNLIIMGDSAGGGFALALAQKMKEENIEKASQIILLSPWLDVAMNNKEISLIEAIDPILGLSGLKKAGKAYAGGEDTNNYLISPINGEVSGLGQISIFTGTKDSLNPDARKFREMAKEKGIDINYYQYQDMVHVWMLFNLPESKEVIEEIKMLVTKGKGNLGDSSQ